MDTMIQVDDIDALKIELKNVVSYYGNARVPMRLLDNMIEDINENKPIDAYKKVKKVQGHLNDHFDTMENIVKILVKGGCVID